MNVGKKIETKIKVLIVEDSRTVSQYLEYILGNDPEIEVIGNVANGQQAVDFVKKTKPDIITMDIDMPIMNGLVATQKIMSTTPIPTIVVTASRNAKKKSNSIEALAAGALSIIEKPVGIGHPNEKEKIKRLLFLVKTYSKVKVIKRRTFTEIPAFTKNNQKVEHKNSVLPSLHKLTKRDYIIIGISSGGPQVLEKIFSEITDKFPIPIFVVQHITAGFLNGMMLWLNRSCNIPICIAKDKEIIESGKIYFAPDHFHMGINKKRIELSKNINGDRICPSVAHLFNSFASCCGSKTISMILTGMGSDGSKEMKILKNAGAITIAQDEASSLVHGMPGEAIKNGGIDYILNPIQIANLLFEIEKRN